MPPKFAEFKDKSIGMIENAAGRIGDIFEPSLRIGVTGLSRAGKTVFITSLVQNLLHGGKLPMFEAHQSGRLSKVYLNPQPDDDVPRFAIEKHAAQLTELREWPSSTRSISQLRLTLEFEKPHRWINTVTAHRLHLDIIDYPGEWLLDLPLLSQSYREFSEQTIELAKHGIRKELSANWLKLANAMVEAKPDAPADQSVIDPTPAEADIIELSQAFTKYLRACTDDAWSLSTLPPGRFLMPGDLEGSPMITFAPLPFSQDMTHIGANRNSSIYSIMERRYESYKSKVIWPFYHDHFARLDRQVILVDALQALNKGQEAMIDMERALGDILVSFNVGKDRFPFNLFTRKIDKILIAATKADHLNHESHDRLEALTERLVARASVHHQSKNIDTKIIAIAAVRATKEAIHETSNDRLPLIVGTPQKGERLNGETYDGQTLKAIFPGDLPEKPDSIFKALDSKPQEQPDQIASLSQVNIIRFRPPDLKAATSDRQNPSKTNDKQAGARQHYGQTLPHIRLDRAIDFLIGDKIQ